MVRQYRTMKMGAKWSASIRQQLTGGTRSVSIGHQPLGKAGPSVSGSNNWGNPVHRYRRATTGDIFHQCRTMTIGGKIRFTASDNGNGEILARHWRAAVMGDGKYWIITELRSTHLPKWCPPPVLLAKVLVPSVHYSRATGSPTVAPHIWITCPWWKDRVLRCRHFIGMPKVE